MLQTSRSLKAYQRGSLETEIAGADPHKIVQMLMAGVIEHCYRAIGAIERKDLETKAASLSKVTSILTALRAGLDFSVGGEIPHNLNSLYEYMSHRATEASRNLDVEPLKEVAKLMSDIKSSWDAIPDEAKQEAYALKEQK